MSPRHAVYLALVVTAMLFGATVVPRAALAGGSESYTTAATCTDATLPRRDLLDAALAAYRRVETAGLLRTHVLTIIDYSLPASERRLWVIDPDGQRVLFHELVAHGRGSASEDDPERALWFGNDPESHRSSLGTFLTGDTYDGVHGHSLELVGLDAGVNDRAVERRIVMHPAPYVSLAHRARWGHIGRSFGCPALDPATAPAIIAAIRDGSVVYAAATSAQPLMCVAASDAALVRVARDGATLARVMRSSAAPTRSGAALAHSAAAPAHAHAAVARRAHRPAAVAAAAGTRRRAAATTGRRSSAASSRT